MIIRLRKKEKLYAQVHRNMLFNNNLSLKAKGLGAILECYSDGFSLTKEAIKAKSKDKEKSLKSAITELEENDFLFRVQTREKGQFMTLWIFDSQNLSIEYVEELLYELDEIIFLTEYTLRGTRYGNANMELPQRDTPQRVSYNNTTIKPSSNLEYLKIMDEVEKKNKQFKNERYYKNVPKNSTKEIEI